MLRGFGKACILQDVVGYRQDNRCFVHLFVLTVHRNLHQLGLGSSTMEGWHGCSMERTVGPEWNQPCRETIHQEWAKSCEMNDLLPLDEKKRHVVL